MADGLELRFFAGLGEHDLARRDFQAIEFCRRGFIDRRGAGFDPSQQDAVLPTADVQAMPAAVVIVGAGRLGENQAFNGFLWIDARMLAGGKRFVIHLEVVAEQ